MQISYSGNSTLWEMSGPLPSASSQDHETEMSTALTCHSNTDYGLTQLNFNISP